MPANAKIALHSDFTVEQHDEIQKLIRVVGKKESFWNDLCEHDRMPKADNLKYRHQILIDPEKVHVLTENVTPDPTSVAAVEFSVQAFNIGSWFKYSRESRDLNKDSIVAMGGNQLAHERLYDLEQIRGNAYRGSTVTASLGQNETWEAFLLRNKTQLKKNGAKPIKGGYFLFVGPGEVINQITIELGDKLKAVGAGEEAIVKGVIGKACGFQFVENDEDYMYTSATVDSATVYSAVCLMIGRNRFGELPVKERSYAGTNDKVGSKGCDPDKEDPMGNWGFISSRIDGVTAVLTDEACVIKFTPNITLIPKTIASPTKTAITTSPYVKIKHVKVGPNQNRDDVTTSSAESTVEAEYDD